MGGVAAMVCDTTGHTVRQGYCYICLMIGGYVGQVTKPEDPGFELYYKSSGAKKDSQSQKIARTAPKNFLNNSRGLSGHYQVKQGF